MAILSVLVTLIGRQLGSLAQAIFGWSVTALFGQLPSTKRAALSVAIVLSLVWPLLVVGLFVPAVAAWSIAAVPAHKWLGDGVIRIVSIVLVVLLPPIVGGITHWVAPAKTRKGGWMRMVAWGYPLTLGYATSCLVTAVTVPIVKALSLVRRWADDHVFVQPKEGQYTAALDDLEAACKSAGVEVVRQPVPRTMSISTRIMRWFAHGALDAIVQADPRMLKAKDIELYLYPADLLVRGEPKVTARVRARIASSSLERHAFLVANPDAQRIEQELDQMNEKAARRDAAETGRVEDARLRAVQEKLESTYIPYEDWVTLDRSLRRIQLELGIPSVDEGRLSTGAPSPRPAPPGSGGTSRTAPRASPPSRPSSSSAGRG